MVNFAENVVNLELKKEGRKEGRKEGKKEGREKRKERRKDGRKIKKSKFYTENKLNQIISACLNLALCVHASELKTYHVLCIDSTLYYEGIL